MKGNLLKIAIPSIILTVVINVTTVKAETIEQVKIESHKVTDELLKDATEIKLDKNGKITSFKNNDGTKEYTIRDYTQMNISVEDTPNIEDSGRYTNIKVDNQGNIIQFTDEKEGIVYSIKYGFNWLSLWVAVLLSIAGIGFVIIEVLHYSDTHRHFRV